MMWHWLLSFFAAPGRPRQSVRRLARLALEALEDRTVPASFTWKAGRNCLARPSPVFQRKIEGSPLHMPKICTWPRGNPLISWEKLGGRGAKQLRPDQPEQPETGMLRRSGK